MKNICFYCIIVFVIKYLGSDFVSLVKVKEYFENYGIADQILEFNQSSATVSDAAKAVGCKEELIAKTLSFLVNDKVILIVVSGNSKIDNRKYKDKFMCKAKMVPFDMVLELVGHEVGGVCPFAVNDGVEVYLDESLKNYEYVYPACGSSNSAIKLSIPLLERYSLYKEWVDVCKIVE